MNHTRATIGELKTLSDVDVAHVGPIAAHHGNCAIVTSGVMLFTSESLNGVCISEDEGATWRAVELSCDQRQTHELSACM